MGKGSLSMKDTTEYLVVRPLEAVPNEYPKHAYNTYAMDERKHLGCALTEQAIDVSSNWKSVYELKGLRRLVFYEVIIV